MSSEKCDRCEYQNEQIQKGKIEIVDIDVIHGLNSDILHKDTLIKDYRIRISEFEKELKELKRNETVKNDTKKTTNKNVNNDGTAKNNDEINLNGKKDYGKNKKSDRDTEIKNRKKNKHNNSDNDELNLTILKKATSQNESDEMYVLHVSKFHKSTNANDIRKFICERTELKANEFEIQRLTTKRKISHVSFKISTSKNEIYKELYNEEIWSPDFSVRPYQK